MKNSLNLVISLLIRNYFKNIQRLAIVLMLMLMAMTMAPQRNDQSQFANKNDIKRS